MQNTNFILISCTIDKSRFKLSSTDDSNPYNVALAHCLETLYSFLGEKGEETNQTHIVFESRGKKEDRDLELEFRRICSGNNRGGTLFPFEIIFSDKKALATGLQVADLVARPIGLRVIRPHQRNRAFDTLKKKFYCLGGRKKLGKDYEGIGMKVIPSA